MFFVKHRPQPDTRQTAESKDIVKGIGDKRHPEYFPIRNVEAKRPFQHKVIKGHRADGKKAEQNENK